MIRHELNAFKLIFPLLYPYRWPVVGIVIAGVCASLAEGLGIGLLAPLLQSAQAVELPNNNPIFSLLNKLVSRYGDERKVFAITVMMLGLIVLKMGFSYLYSSFCVLLTHHIEHHYRCRVFAQILALPPGYFDKSSSGKLLSMGQETSHMVAAVASFIWICINFCTLLVFSGILLMVAWH